MNRYDTEFKRERIDTRMLSGSDEDIEIAAGIIKSKGLVAFPTETVYGLGADGMDENAVKKIYAAKGRPADNPLILHIADKKSAFQICKNVGIKAQKLMDEFWPGPLTLVLSARDDVPLTVRGGLDTVGVRMPDNEIALKLISAANTPIAAPSANISGSPSPTNAVHVMDDMKGKIEAVIDGGECSRGLESTVVIATEEEELIIARPGYITKENIEDVTGYEVKYHDSLVNMHLENDVINPSSPGMKYRHYAPKAEMILFSGSGENIEQAMKKYSEHVKNTGGKVGIIPLRDTLDEQARNFFKDLRELDKEGVDVILARDVEKAGVGFALMNRMIKSAGYRIIYVDEE